MSTMFRLVGSFLLMSAAIPAMAAPTPVPEPMSMSLLAVGAGGLFMVRALRKRSK